MDDPPQARDGSCGLEARAPGDPAPRVRMLTANGRHHDGYARAQGTPHHRREPRGGRLACAEPRRSRPHRRLRHCSPRISDETGVRTADYVLYVDRLAIGTIEAKPGGTLTGVEEQSAKYAVGFPDDVPAHHLPLPFVFERHQSGRPGEGAGFPCVARAPPERVERAASDLRRCPPAQAVPAGSPSTTRRDRPPAARGHSGSAPACLRGGGTGPGSRGTPGRRVAENCSPIS